ALFVSAAYGAGCAALEIVPQGDGLTVREKWRSRKNLQTLMATGMVVDGHVYGWHGDISAILLRCLDLRTGESTRDGRQTGRGWRWWRWTDSCCACTSAARCSCWRPTRSVTRSRGSCRS